MQKLEQAAKASDISPVKAAQNIQDGLRQHGGMQAERRGRDMEMETNP
jgi:hypothetical protein